LSLKACLRIRRFNKDEQRFAVEFFGEPICGYCGNDNPTRWDHIVPVAKNGATVLGNMMLSCSECDNSKSQVDFAKWMLGDYPKSPSTRGVSDVHGRIERIKAYAKQHDYRPAPIEAELNEAEQQRLNHIRNEIVSLRREVESLITDFKDRTGFR